MDGWFLQERGVALGRLVYTGDRWGLRWMAGFYRREVGLRWAGIYRRQVEPRVDGWFLEETGGLVSTGDRWGLR